MESNPAYGWDAVLPENLYETVPHSTKDNKSKARFWRRQVHLID